MLGDILLINDMHKDAAQAIFEHVLDARKIWMNDTGILLAYRGSLAQGNQNWLMPWENY